MHLSEKTTKQVTETKYLATDNSDRYRTIMRYFYEQYEKLQYWLYQTDIYEELMTLEYFQRKKYTEEQCQQDLTQLCEWKNLYAVQDTKKVLSIEAFKNRKYRYQLSEYSVEIERMLIRLENLSIEGASLEPSLVERIRNEIVKIADMEHASNEQTNSWWKSLNDDFIKLNRNYQDYIRELNSLKAEEMMKTRQFLVFKDKFLEYLRQFVKSLQYHSGTIEGCLRKVSEEQCNHILHKVLEHEKTIPRTNGDLDEGFFMENAIGRWNNIYRWFVAVDGKEPESSKVFEMTNEMIRKITRYATQLSSLGHGGASRKEEYLKVLSDFHRQASIEDCHKLAACVFGVEKTFHLKGDFKRDTESINSGVYEESPTEFIIAPRIRTYRQKAERSGIAERTALKEEMKRKMLEKAEREKKLLQGYIREQVLDFSALPVIEPEVRDTFLVWLSKALENKSRVAKTEDGKKYRVTGGEAGERCKVKCTDGVFEMPSYRIIFEEEGQP